MKETLEKINALANEIDNHPSGKKYVIVRNQKVTELVLDHISKNIK